MKETKFERELRNRKECAAKELIDAFKKVHLIKIGVTNHYCTENCNNCQLINQLEMAYNSKLVNVDNPG